MFSNYEIIGSFFSSWFQLEIPLIFHYRVMMRADWRDLCPSCLFSFCLCVCFVLPGPQVQFVVPRLPVRPPLACVIYVKNFFFKCVFIFEREKKRVQAGEEDTELEAGSRL